MPRTRKSYSKKSGVSKALVSRVRKLETKQKADDKATERKVFYYNTFTLMNSTWSANNAFALRTAQGVAAEGNTAPGLNRIGNAILLRSLTIDFRAFLPTTGDGILNNPNSSSMVRVIIADNLTDTTPLTAADILEQPTYNIVSPYKNKIGSGKRYRIYGDYVFPLNDRQPQKHWKFKMALPKSGRVVHYNGSASTNPSDFNLSMIWVATEIAPLSSNQPTLQYYVKSRFEDA